MSIEIDLVALKAAAEAASEDGWDRTRSFGQLGVQDSKYMLCDSDASYIAAANPTVVLALIERLRVAEAKLAPVEHPPGTNAIFNRRMVLCPIC